MQILHIDSSISGDQSVSRQLTANIVAKLTAANPGAAVAYRDLAAAPVPHQSPAILLSKIQPPTDEADRDGQVCTEIAATDAALDAFLAADVIVLGAPMYNFSIPSQLKAWIDSLAVAGKTFRYTEAGAEGLAGGKKVIIASSRGGLYGADSPIAFMDHQENYLRGFFGFIGVTDIAFVRAEGLALGPEQRRLALENAAADTTALAA